MTEIVRLGDVARLSIENRTEDDVVCGDPYMLTLVGDDERWKREVAEEVDEAKEVVEVEIEEAQNLPEGERER